MTLSIFEKNLKLLEDRNPLMALQLLLDANKASGQKKVQHSFVATKASLLFVSCLESCLKSVEHAIDQKKTVVVFEKDPSKAKKLLASAKLSKLLHSDLFFWHLEKECSEVFCLKMAWTFLYCQREYCLTDSLLQAALETAFARAELIALDYKDYGLGVFRNIFFNQEIFAQSFIGKSLELTGVGVICGAGPSLQTYLPFLQTIAPKVWLFAGGSCLEVFKKNDQAVDFACTIDPKLCVDFCLAQSLFYSLRALPETLQKFQGSYYVFPGSGESLVETKLWETVTSYPAILESGWNVGNFMATCALECGLRTIIFVGLDMVYQEDKEYAADVNQRCEYKTKKEVFDHDGALKTTRDDFLAARDFYEDLIKSNKEAHFYRLGSKGLVIDGVKDISQEQVQELIRNTSKESFCSDSLPLSKKKIEDFFKDLKKSVVQTQRLVDTVFQKAAALRPDSCLFGAIALQEHDLEQELFFQVIFTRLWEVWQWKIMGPLQVAAPQAFLKKMVFLKDVVKAYENFFEEMP